MDKKEFEQRFMSVYRQSFIERYGEVDGGSRQIERLGRLAAGMLFDMSVRLTGGPTPQELLARAVPNEKA